MSNDTHDDDLSDLANWRLQLDEGDQLHVWPAPQPGETEPPDVRLLLTAGRAGDLSRVLSAYGRMVALVSEVAEVSGTEDSLARGLADASAAITGRPVWPAAPSRVSKRERLTAMAVLQAARPELSHSTLVAIVDAAAWWLDNDKDHLATDLLEAVAPGETSQLIYSTLLQQPAPQHP